MSHRDHRNARSASRKQTYQVSLVTVAAEEVSSEIPKPPGQLPHHGPDVWGVLTQNGCLQPMILEVSFERRTLPLVGKEHESGPAPVREAEGQAKHEPFGAAEKRGSREVDNDQGLICLADRTGQTRLDNTGIKLRKVHHEPGHPVLEVGFFEVFGLIDPIASRFAAEQLKVCFELNRYPSFLGADDQERPWSALSQGSLVDSISDRAKGLWQVSPPLTDSREVDAL
jgi:hypothetical protein